MTPRDPTLKDPLNWATYPEGFQDLGVPEVRGPHGAGRPAEGPGLKLGIR